MIAAASSRRTKDRKRDELTFHANGTHPFLQKKQGAALKTKKKKGHDLSKVNDHPAFHFSVPTVEVSFHYNYSFGVLAFPTPKV